MEALPDVGHTTPRSKRDKQATEIAKAIQANWKAGSVEIVSEYIYPENRKVLEDNCYTLDNGCNITHLVAHIGPPTTTVSWPVSLDGNNASHWPVGV